MAYYYFIGPNGQSLSSKGIQAYRRGTKVVQRWGAITVTGSKLKKFRWLGKYPKVTEKKFRTVDSASLHLSELIRTKLQRGYRKIPARHGIRKA